MVELEIADAVSGEFLGGGHAGFNKIKLLSLRKLLTRDDISLLRWTANNSILNLISG